MIDVYCDFENELEQNKQKYEKLIGSKTNENDEMKQKNKNLLIVNETHRNELRTKTERKCKND